MEILGQYRSQRIADGNGPRAHAGNGSYLFTRRYRRRNKAVSVIDPIELDVRPKTARIRVGDTIRVLAVPRDRAGNSVPDLRVFQAVMDFRILQLLGGSSFVGIDTGVARINFCAAHREVLATITVSGRD